MLLCVRILFHLTSSILEIYRWIAVLDQSYELLDVFEEGDVADTIRRIESFYRLNPYEYPNDSDLEDDDVTLLTREDYEDEDCVASDATDTANREGAPRPTPPQSTTEDISSSRKEERPEETPLNRSAGNENVRHSPYAS